MRRSGLPRAGFRGFTIIEVIVASMVLVVGVLVILSSFSVNLRQSTQTRERLQADLVLENLVEEVLAHPYGEQAPEAWNKGQKSFEFIVEGLPQKAEFVQQVSPAKEGNGSFFGQAEGDVDKVTLSVSWTEAVGEGASAEDRSLSLDLTVRRDL